MLAVTAVAPQHPVIRLTGCNRQRGNFDEPLAHIVDVLQRAGYTRITDVSFDDGVWEAEAPNAQKQRVDLKLDPDTATIISEKLDD